MKKIRSFGRGTALFIFVVILVGGIIGYKVALGCYLRSDRFRQKISEAIGRKLKADGTLMPLQLTDSTFYSDGFAARGGPGAFFSTLRADQIRAVIRWRALFDHACQIDELTAQRLDLQFSERSIISPAPPRTGALPGPRGSEWRVDLRQASVAESTWRWGAGTPAPGQITGAAFVLRPSDEAWLIDARSGKISQQGWPDLSIESVKIRYTHDALFITESTLRSGAGRILVTGEVDFHRGADLRGQMADVPLEPLLPIDWRLRLTGKLSGAVQVRTPPGQGSVTLEGNIQLSDAQVQALPLLDQIATFTRTEQFRRMSLSKASLTFTREGDRISAKDIVIESEGLLRMEGNCTISRDQIDGLFQVGVTASSLQWLPGSQARVFTVTHDGYYWTPLHLTGPAAHPIEDLTPRLLAAAAGQLLQNSEEAVQDVAKTLFDLIPH